MVVEVSKMIKVPLMVLQGANDPRVLKVESDEIVAAAKKNGAPETTGRPVSARRILARLGLARRACAFASLGCSISGPRSARASRLARGPLALFVSNPAGQDGWRR